MNKKTLFILSILAFSLTSCVVTNVPSSIDDRYVEKYSSLAEQNSKVINAGYIHLLSKKPNGNFILQNVYPDTKKVTKRAEYTDYTMTVRVGEYKEWHWETGKLLKEGRFDIEGKPHGMWKDYSIKTGNLISEQSYHHGEFNDIETNYIDTTERMIAFKVYHPDKMTKNAQPKIIYEEYPTPEGTKIYFKKKWILLQDTVKSQMFNAATFYAPLCNSEKDSTAIYQCQINEFLRYITKRINVKDELNNGIREVNILFNFTINEKGEASQPQIIKTVDAKTNDKILKLIKEMPKWNPATVDGAPVSEVVTIPINFKIRPNPTY